MLLVLEQARRTLMEQWHRKEMVNGMDLNNTELPGTEKVCECLEAQLTTETSWH